MANVNDFLPWATGMGANVLTQPEYVANPAVAAGVATGTAVSALYNKAQRQGSFWGAVLAQFIINELAQDVLDDGNVASHVTQFANAVLALTSIYALINSPTFTGVPAGPTAAPGTNTTQLSTTAFTTGAITTLNAALTAAINLKAPNNSPNLTGSPTIANTPAPGDSSHLIADTAFVEGEITTAIAGYPVTHVVRSAGHAIVQNNGFSVAHGLSSVEYVIGWAVCVNNNNGYTAAQKIMIGSTLNDSPRTTIGFDGANMFIYFDATTMQLQDHGGGGTGAITSPNWTITLNAYGRP